MAIKVLNPGALTTVQDLGRKGLQQFGIPSCGVMDTRAFAAANRLCGNEPGAAALEMTLFGGTYQFTEDGIFALTGADMEGTLDGAPVTRYAPVFVKAGQVLQLGMAKAGCRCYLAWAGGIDVPLVMGSRSTDLKAGLGGYEGRKLQAGDVIPTGCFEGSFEALETLCEEPCVMTGRAVIRAVAGPQADCFTKAGLQTFFSKPYKLSGQCDRMGYRLEGPAIEIAEPAEGDGRKAKTTDIISDGIVFGSVQVPSSGLPIVLMADRQTTGGYAKIATVCSFDLPLLAQLKPGDTVQFQRITVQEAQQILAEQK
ncbi:MAG: biotin-dependent carboxyltransferase family protein [Firmicutes bacterium]|nr:biotin-dependent carboxyltransferase family protein [Bacillota bacterium]